VKKLTIIILKIKGRRSKNFWCNRVSLMIIAYEQFIKVFSFAVFIASNEFLKKIVLKRLGKVIVYIMCLLILPGKWWGRVQRYKDCDFWLLKKEEISEMGKVKIAVGSVVHLCFSYIQF
jgi:hypothetical protein